MHRAVTIAVVVTASVPVAQFVGRGLAGGQSRAAG
jgi:hypothetical protein